MNKVIVTCALTGVLTDPAQHAVPVTPEEMAKEAEAAYNAGASIVHCHFRDQRPGKGALPSWDPEIAVAICDAIRARVPELIINMSTGTVGPDISGPLACLKRVRPEIAALNAGSLNYLKIKTSGEWAWKPFVFDNPVEKIAAYLNVMKEVGTIPECECFDTGIVRSVAMFEKNGLLSAPAHISLVMGVASGMPAKPAWLPLLVDEMPKGAHWQVIAIGREDVWPLHRRAIELGGNVRTGLEDTFYLPNGDKARSNGPLIEALVKLVRETGREVATSDEVRAIFGFKN